MTEFVQKRRAFIIVFLVAMAFCNLAVPFRQRSSLRNGYQDFTIYYMSGLMVRSGRAADLYNLAAQYRTQLTFAHVPIRQGPLPYNHPPFEALVFVPFTLLAYWPAYLLWTALNLIMLAVSVFLLRRQFAPFAAVPPLFSIMGTIAFFPVTIGIYQGQDVILLLLLFVMAVICLDRGNVAAAGALLAAGLFRPHLIVPLVVLFLFAVRSWRILLGFAPVALLLGAISVALIGWRGPLDYIRFVLDVGEKGVRNFGPQVVPNLRGLIANLPGFNPSAEWAALLLVVSSAIVFLVALRRIRSGRDSFLFVSSLAVVTTILINFHALAYDLALLLPTALGLLSGAVGAERTKIGAASIVLFGLLFLTPLYIFLLIVTERFFWFALILLALYLKLVLAPFPAQARS